MFKKTARKNTASKRTKQVSTSSSDDDAVAVTKKVRSVSGIVAASSTKLQKEEFLVAFSASGTAASLVNDTATRTIDIDGGDEEKVSFIGTSEDGVYAGLQNYKQLVNKKVEKVNQSNAGKLLAGPLYAPSNVRLTTRFDYAGDVCKDYKETGHCGFGDSCKFMHDRGDFKTGWQLDMEWDKVKQRKIDEFITANRGEEDEEQPMLDLDCPICGNEFRDPVATTCDHVFCESCAIKHHTKSSGKCFTCDQSTGGIFSVAKETRMQLKEKMDHVAAREAAVRAKTGSDPFGPQDDEENDQ